MQHVDNTHSNICVHIKKTPHNTQTGAKRPTRIKQGNKDADGW